MWDKKTIPSVVLNYLTDDVVSGLLVKSKNVEKNTVSGCSPTYSTHRKVWNNCDQEGVYIFLI